MDIIATLQQVRDNLLTALLSASANPAPSYTIEGQSVSFTDYIRMLLDALAGVNTAILTYQPFELKSVIR